MYHYSSCLNLSKIKYHLTINPIKKGRKKAKYFDVKLNRQSFLKHEFQRNFHYVNPPIFYSKINFLLLFCIKNRFSKLLKIAPF